MAPPTALWENSGAPFHANVTAVFAITMKGFCDAAAPRGLTLMPRETPQPTPLTHAHRLPPPATALHIIASVHPNMATQWDWALPASHITRLLQPRCVPVPPPPLLLPLSDAHFSVRLPLHGRIWASFAKIHQRICVTPSYFLSSRFSF